MIPPPIRAVIWAVVIGRRIIMTKFSGRIQQIIDKVLGAARSSQTVYILGS
jgi:hypothetical protein